MTWVCPSSPTRSLPCTARSSSPSAFCEELIARKLPVLWGINTCVTDILRDDALLPLYREAGLIDVSLGTGPQSLKSVDFGFDRKRQLARAQTVEFASAPAGRKSQRADQKAVKTPTLACGGGAEQFNDGFVEVAGKEADPGRIDQSASAAATLCGGGTAGLRARTARALPGGAAVIDGRGGRGPAPAAGAARRMRCRRGTPRRAVGRRAHR